MSVVFIGSIEFSWYCLEEILKEHLAEVIGIFNIDPKYSLGVSDYRNQKNLASKYGVPHYFFRNINDIETVKKIRKLSPDLILVFGLSQIIRSEILNIPRLGVIGTHPALLPKNRGRAAIPWSIIKGLKKSGLTLFYLGEEADRGDIIDQKRWLITDHDDATSIYKKMVSAGIRLLAKNLPLIESGKAKRIPQPEKSNWWPKRTPEDGKIDWNDSVKDIDRLIRATTWPYPGAFTNFGEAKLIIWKGSPLKTSIKASPGTLIRKEKSTLLIRARNGAIKINKFESNYRNFKIGDVFE